MGKGKCCEYVLWNGILCVKGVYACPAQLTSNIRINQPGELGRCLNLKWQAKTNDSLDSYLKMIPAAGMMLTGEIFSKSWFFNMCSLKPLDSKERFSKIQEHLCKTDAVCVVKTGDEVLLIMADTKLSQCLGVKQDSNSLHCVVLSKQSKLQRGKHTPPASPKQMGLPFLEICPTSSILTLNCLKETFNSCLTQNKLTKNTIEKCGTNVIEDDHARSRKGLQDEKRIAQSREEHPERKRHKSEHTPTASLSVDKTDVITVPNHMSKKKRHKSETSRKSNLGMSPASQNTSKTLDDDSTSRGSAKGVCCDKTKDVDTNKNKSFEHAESETPSLKKSKIVKDSQTENSSREDKEKKKTNKMKVSNISIMEKKQMESEKVLSQLQLSHSKTNVQSLGRIPKKKSTNSKTNECKAETCRKFGEEKTDNATPKKRAKHSQALNSGEKKDKVNMDSTTPNCKAKHTKGEISDGKIEKGTSKKDRTINDTHVSHNKDVNLQEKDQIAVISISKERHLSGNESELCYERDATDDLFMLENSSKSDEDLLRLLSDRDLQCGNVSLPKFINNPHTFVKHKQVEIPGLGDLDQLKYLECKERRGKVLRNMKRTDDGLLVMITHANIGLVAHSKTISLEDLTFQSLHGMPQDEVSPRFESCSLCLAVNEVFTTQDLPSIQRRKTTVDQTDQYNLKITVNFSTPDKISLPNAPDATTNNTVEIKQTDDEVVCKEGPTAGKDIDQMNHSDKKDDAELLIISSNKKEITKTKSSKLNIELIKPNKIVTGEPSADRQYTIKEETLGTTDPCIASSAVPVQQKEGVIDEKTEVDGELRYQGLVTGIKQAPGVDHQLMSTNCQTSIDSELPEIVKEEVRSRKDVPYENVVMRESTSSNNRQDRQSYVKASSSSVKQGGDSVLMTLPSNLSQDGQFFTVESSPSNIKKDSQSVIKASTSNVGQYRKSIVKASASNYSQDGQFFTVKSSPSDVKQEGKSVIKASLSNDRQDGQFFKASASDIRQNEESVTKATSRSLRSEEKQYENMQSSDSQSSEKQAKKIKTTRAQGVTKKVSVETNSERLERQDNVSSGCELSQSRNNTPKMGTLQKRLEKIVEMPVPKEMKAKKNEKSEKSEKRQARQFHPYKKDPKPNKSDKPSWSFEIAYSDMEELLQNLTENMFQVDSRAPADVRKWRKGTTRSSLGRVRGRFCGHRFTRSEIPKTKPCSTESREYDDDYEIDPELISSMEERARQADMVEETWQNKSEEETVFIEEMCVYNQEKEQNIAPETSAHIRTEKSTTTLTIPGMGKTSTFSGENLDDMDSSSEELFQDNNLQREMTPTIDVAKKDNTTTIGMSDKQTVVSKSDSLIAKNKVISCKKTNSISKRSCVTYKSTKPLSNCSVSLRNTDMVSKSTDALLKDAEDAPKNAHVSKDTAAFSDSADIVFQNPNVASKNSTDENLHRDSKLKSKSWTESKDIKVNVTKRLTKASNDTLNMKKEEQNVVKTEVKEAVNEDKFSVNYIKTQPKSESATATVVKKEDISEDNKNLKKPGSFGTKATRFTEPRILSSDSEVCLDWSDDEVLSETGRPDTDTDDDDKTFVVIDTVVDCDSDSTSVTDSRTNLSNEQSGLDKLNQNVNVSPNNNKVTKTCKSIKDTSTNSDGNESAYVYNSDMFITVDEVTEQELTEPDKHELNIHTTSHDEQNIHTSDVCGLKVNESQIIKGKATKPVESIYSDKDSICHTAINERYLDKKTENIDKVFIKQGDNTERVHRVNDGNVNTDKLKNTLQEDATGVQKLASDAINRTEQDGKGSINIKVENEKSGSEPNDFIVTSSGQDDRAVLSCLAVKKENLDVTNISNVVENQCPSAKTPFEKTSSFDTAAKKHTNNTLTTLRDSSQPSIDTQSASSSTECNSSCDTPIKNTSIVKKYETHDNPRGETNAQAPINEIQVKTDIKTEANDSLHSKCSIGVSNNESTKSDTSFIKCDKNTTSDTIILYTTCETIKTYSIQTIIGNKSSKSTCSFPSTPCDKNSIPCNSGIATKTSPAIPCLSDITSKATNSISYTSTSSSIPCTVSTITTNTTKTHLSTSDISDETVTSIQYTLSENSKKMVNSTSCTCDNTSITNSIPCTVSGITTEAVNSSDIKATLVTSCVSTSCDITAKKTSCTTKSTTKKESYVVCTSHLTTTSHSTTNNNLITNSSSTTTNTSSIPCTASSTTNKTSSNQSNSAAGLLTSPRGPLLNTPYPPFSSPPWAMTTPPLIPPFQYGMYGVPYQGTPPLPYAPLSPNTQHFYPNMYSPPVYNYQQGQWNYNLPFQAPWSSPYQTMSQFNPHQHASQVSPFQRNTNYSYATNNANPNAFPNMFWKNNPH